MRPEAAQCILSNQRRRCEECRSVPGILTRAYLSAHTLAVIAEGRRRQRREAYSQYVELESYTSEPVSQTRCFRPKKPFFNRFIVRLNASESPILSLAAAVAKKMPRKTMQEDSDTYFCCWARCWASSFAAASLASSSSLVMRRGFTSGRGRRYLHQRQQRPEKREKCS